MINLRNSALNLAHDKLCEFFFLVRLCGHIELVLIFKFFVHVLYLFSDVSQWHALNRRLPFLSGRNVLTVIDFGLFFNGIEPRKIRKVVDRALQNVEITLGRKGQLAAILSKSNTFFSRLTSLEFQGFLWGCIGCRIV